MNTFRDLSVAQVTTPLDLTDMTLRYIVCQLELPLAGTDLEPE